MIVTNCRVIEVPELVSVQTRFINSSEAANFKYSRNCIGLADVNGSTVIPQEPIHLLSPPPINFPDVNDSLSNITPAINPSTVLLPEKDAPVNINSTNGINSTSTFPSRTSITSSAMLPTTSMSVKTPSYVAALSHDPVQTINIPVTTIPSLIGPSVQNPPFTAPPSGNILPYVKPIEQSTPVVNNPTRTLPPLLASMPSKSFTPNTPVIPPNIPSLAYNTPLPYYPSPAINANNASLYNNSRPTYIAPTSKSIEIDLTRSQTPPPLVPVIQAPQVVYSRKSIDVSTNVLNTSITGRTKVTKALNTKNIEVNGNYKISTVNVSTQCNFMNKKVSRDRVTQTDQKTYCSIGVQCDVENSIEYEMEMIEEDPIAVEENEKLIFLAFVNSKSYSFDGQYSECLICGEVTKNEKQLLHHMALHYGPSVLCSKCGRYFEHILLHLGHNCQKNIKNSITLRPQNNGSSSGGGNILCSICGCANLKDLVEHECKFNENSILIKSCRRVICQHGYGAAVKVPSRGKRRRFVQICGHSSCNKFKRKRWIKGQLRYFKYRNNEMKKFTKKKKINN